MIWLWLSFIFIITALLALDLGVLHRKAHVIKPKEAFIWTAFWITLALLFNVLIYYIYEYHWYDVGKTIGNELNGSQAALKFFTGYLLEKSLSLDNIFVIAMIFSYFSVLPIYQHRVLFWGIFGAIVLRGFMIALGIALIKQFSWMVYIFGIFLIITAVKLLISRHDNIEPGKNPLIKLAQKMFPVSATYDQDHFFTKINGQTSMTPLFLVLIIVESSDVLFAIDSIPAIFAVTTDSFIVFTSNIFAILGLRSLYFALAAVIEKFRYLKMSLVYILAYVGVKMILSHHYPIPTFASLMVIIGILSVGILASVYATKKDTAKLKSPI
jgi:tellurite resistance protein TerC